MLILSYVIGTPLVVLAIAKLIIERAPRQGHELEAMSITTIYPEGYVHIKKTVELYDRDEDNPTRARKRRPSVVTKSEIV